ncbi:NAD-dependent protein deacylase [Peptacetobacter sp.]|uniref:NAD-dependent protein deacylase n=1 Tax=Peptacetobacter sp. TaxID=2991975 RepID=UPI00261DE7C7|nr:NAD-dependent protein deacylase [Peptacetobacter sp.]
MYEKEINKLKDLIQSHNNIVFFGGAGVSTESNIPDFRSSNGLFNQKLNRHFSPEEVVSFSFFVRYPEYFYEFYKDKLVYTDAKPNNAHKALAHLEKIGKLKAIVTQNIDGLHQMAGSKNVFELHGSVQRNYCTKCHKFFDLDYILNSDEIIPKCDECGSIIKPDVVLYEESLNDNVVNGAITAIKNADLLIVGGTSLVVYPAASFINYYKGKDLVIINKSSTSLDNKVSLKINAPIGEILNEAILK